MQLERICIWLTVTQMANCKKKEEEKNAAIFLEGNSQSAAVAAILSVAVPARCSWRQEYDRSGADWHRRPITLS